MGYTIFETTDHRQLMHLRDTEHNAGRILAEMERDKARGDVPPPENFDSDHPQTLWHSHRNPSVSAVGVVLLPARQFEMLTMFATIVSA